MNNFSRLSNFSRIARKYFSEGDTNTIRQSIDSAKSLDEAIDIILEADDLSLLAACGITSLLNRIARHKFVDFTPEDWKKLDNDMVRATKEHLNRGDEILLPMMLSDEVVIQKLQEKRPQLLSKEFMKTWKNQQPAIRKPVMSRWFPTLHQLGFIQYI